VRPRTIATRVVNAVAEAFIAVNLERRMDASSNAGTFLRERLEQMKARLEDSERSLNALARAKEIIKVDDKQSSIDSIRLGEYTMALAKAQQERINTETGAVTATTRTTTITRAPTTTAGSA